MKLHIIPLHTRAPAQPSSNPKAPANSKLGGISFTITTLGAFKDGVETKTTKDQVFGRTDPMEYYEGTNRKVSFEFQIGASTASPTAIESNARAVALFMQLQYPAYSHEKRVRGGRVVRGPVLAAPPLFNVKFLKGKIEIFDEIGYISGLGYTAGSDSTAKALRKAGNDLIGVKTYNISFDFSVIHRDIAGFDIDLRSFSGDTRLKAPNANPFYPFNQIAK
jgi:hypothetical protein